MKQVKLKFNKIITFAFALTAVSCSLGKNDETQIKSPNFVVIFTDDMGYGDLGVYGHPTIRTPNLDQMAVEGQKWTNFYVAAPVCTPSRAGLLTGRLPIRTGLATGVLFPNSAGGMPEHEITIAKALKKKDYATACIGKWHLGHLPQYLPTNHGFDYYYGIPYSNDMDRVEGTDYHETCVNPKIDLFQVPIMQNEEVIERPADQTTLTKRYTHEAVRFIEQNKDRPFFLYLAHNMPHVPLFRSREFEVKSERGIYGDVIEEIDWSVGEVLKALKKNGLDEKTLVVFTSDNGPWLIFEDHGGSAGLLREGKGSTFEGGMRVPAIFWWKNNIKPSVITDLGATLDLFPTILHLADVEIPTDRIYDGYDISGVLLNEQKSPRDKIFYFNGDELFAVRKNNFKAHFKTKIPYIGKPAEKHETPLLYNLAHDPSEKYEIGANHPEIIREIIEESKKLKASITPVENQIKKKLPGN